jgi:hypothetical protein
MKSFLKKLSILSIVTFFSLLPLLTFAGPSTGGMGSAGNSSTGGMDAAVQVTPIKIVNPLAAKGVNTISDFLKLVINDLVLPIGALIAVLYIMYAGFLMVTARGDEGQLKDAKAAFTHAAIGTAILLGSWVIAEVIQTTVNSLTSAS